jgi:hypothetical protein
MGPFRLTVKQRGKRFVASSDAHDITSVAQTPADAAECARKMALAACGKEGRNAVLLLRVDEPGKSTIVLQPLDRPVALDGAAKAEASWRYIATVSGETSAKNAT